MVVGGGSGDDPVVYSDLCVAAAKGATSCQWGTVVRTTTSQNIKSQFVH